MWLLCESCGTCASSPKKKRVEDYYSLPEVQDVLKGDYSGACNGSLVKPRAANVSECAEGMKRAQVLMVICEHLLSEQGIAARKSKEGLQRLEECLGTFANLPDGGLGWAADFNPRAQWGE